MLFEIKDYDKKIYREDIANFLPDKMIDIHCHIWKDEIRKTLTEKRTVTWPSLVAKDNSIEDLIETYRLMFPNKTVTPLMFATTSEDMNKMNTYVKACSKSTGFPALYFSHPNESAEVLEYKIRDGHFLGTKSYLSFAPKYIPEAEIRIFDFFPKHQLRKLNKMGAIMMLHIPRPLRFKDPVNIAQIREIAQEFPNIKLIIAHIGRAYIPSDLGNAFNELSDCKNIMFDFCANTSEFAMTELLRSVGAGRIMFGSDLPILRMRTKRIEEKGTYINLVPPKLYGDTSIDPHLREVSEEEAKKITFFMYEEILAFKKAAIKTELTKNDICDVFYNNAQNLINKAKSDIYQE